MQYLCESRKTMHQMVFLRYEELGAICLDYAPGVLTVQRGEQGIVFICRHVAAEPIEEFQGNCFNELPVRVTTHEGPTTLYLKPITRILSDTPIVVDCSDELPVKFALDKTSSICQTKQGLIICNSSTTLDPALGLDAKLETLDSS